MGLLRLSTVPLTAGLVAQMFGPRYMATLFGFVFLSHELGSFFLSVRLGGWLYDRYGSYGLVWWLSIALGLISALLHCPIDERAVAPFAHPELRQHPQAVGTMDMPAATVCVSAIRLHPSVEATSTQATGDRGRYPDHR